MSRSNPFYRSLAWRQLRRLVLLKSAAASPTGRPVCFNCGGLATEVDHIVPLSEARHLALVEANCRPSCKPCNVGRVSGRQAAQARMYREGIEYPRQREW